MIATGILHELSWHWNVLAWLLGAVVLLVALVGSVLVTTALRRGPRPLERALFAFGPAALAPMVVFLLLRAFELVEPAFGPGPQYWLLGWIPGSAHAFVHPYDTLVAVHVVAAGSAGLTALICALLFPPRRPSGIPPLPGRVFAGAWLLATSFLVPLVAWRVFVVDADGAILLDVLGTLPVLAATMGLRAFAQLPPTMETKQTPEEAAPERPTPDFRKAWIDAGLLRPDAKPLTRTAAKEDDGPVPPRTHTAWLAANAPGSPPRALDTLLEALPGSGDLYVLGDVPDAAEEALLTALFADLLGTGGSRILVVHPDAAALAARWNAALVRARTWHPGAVAVGADALQEALDGHQLPALVAVTVEDLGNRLLRMVAHDAKGWATGLDLVVVHRPDRGSPLAVTHTAFVFRRWQLAVRGVVEPAVLVTLPDTPAHRGFAERLFPGRTPHRIRYGPRTVAASTSWPGHEPRPDASLSWMARAAEVVTALDHPVEAIDPRGRWGQDALPEKSLLTRHPLWQGHASVAAFGAGDLVEAVGSLPNRLPTSAQHQTLWSLPKEPAARFLHPERLAALERDGRLPRPAPVVGIANRFLRLAHLDAALKEATSDERSLRQAFGDDLVDFRLRTTADPATRAPTHSARRVGNRIVRSPHLLGTASSARPRGTTVTNDIVEVVEDRTGSVIAEVDARTAPTRFYPRRVFARGARRFVVPMHAFDARRRKLTVQVASEREHVTRPVMTFDLEERRTTIEPVLRRQGAFRVTTRRAECLITERVHASWVPGRDQEDRFDTVETSYDTEVVFFHPAGAEEGLGLFHLANVVEGFLPVFLRCAPDDVAVVVVGEAFVDGLGPGLAIVDRYVGGMGVARAVDDTMIQELLTWARALLFDCSCMAGCERCTPPQVLRVGPAKQEVLALLEGL